MERVTRNLDASVQERVARNQATFRKANEDIERAAQKYDIDAELVPFICECAAETCTEVLQLTLPEYEAVRKEPRRFVNARGHHVHAQGLGVVVFESERYEVVEKQELAGAIAEELDPRR